MFGAAFRLGITGLIAIGVSGLLGWGVGTVFDEELVAGDSYGVQYTAERCADYFEYEPQASSCEEAATLHHFHEAVGYRLSAGLLGVAALAIYGLLRRWWKWMRARDPLPEGFEATVGMSIFGIMAAGLLAGTALELIFGETSGIGGPLSSGLVALAVALTYAVSLLKALARRADAGIRAESAGPAQA